MKKVLVTRPEGPARDKFSKLIEARGALPLFGALSKIELMSVEWPAEDSYQAVVVTSGNAVRVLNQGNNPLTSLPCFVVGDSTAAVATQAGFDKILNADGDLSALLDLVKEKLDPAKGPLLYLSGKETAGDLPAELLHKGFETRSLIVYRAVWLDVLPENIKFEINRNGLDMITFLSPLAARVFTKLVCDSETSIDLSSTEAICISEAVAQGLDTASWAKIKVSRRPKLNDLVKLI